MCDAQWRLAGEDEIAEMVSFCSARFAQVSWSPTAWVDYIGWYVRSGLAAVCWDGEVLRGVMMGRPVEKAEEGVCERWARGEMRGRVLWVELVVLEKVPFGGAILFALSVLLERGFSFDFLAWNRTPWREEPVMFPVKRLEALCI